MARKKEQNNYFNMFVTSIDYSCKCADMLLDFINNYPTDTADIKKKLEEIHIIEHEADEHFNDIYERLMKEFLPPIDREDIMELAHMIDDLTDSIESVAQRLYMYNVISLKKDMVKFVELIKNSCDNLKLALQDFSNYKKSTEISKLIKKVLLVEEDGDLFYQKITHDLFTNEKDPIEIVRWRAIYHILETCLDDSSEVANCIQGVILKNS